MSEPGRRTADYDYRLPPEQVARYPATDRDESRLIVVPRGGGAVDHLHFRDVPRLFRAGDLLVVNESRVMPARLLGAKPTGAPAEILLIRPHDPGSDRDWTRAAHDWEALVRPGSKLKPGRTVVVSPDLVVEIVDSLPGGARHVRLVTDLEPLDAVERYGHVPLPPYLERADEDLDRERYQTVYAQVPGSVAAPTAGLHFTDALLARLQEVGVERAGVVLHVGPGTFRPVDAEDPAHHEMHTELFRVPAETSAAIARTRERGGRVWAVGTTVVRTLESVATADGAVPAGAGATDLFIRPPHAFRVVEGLITNFHLPRSTLLMLVAAFGGYAPVMSAYHEAVEAGYRFYSYGDAMALV